MAKKIKKRERGESLKDMKKIIKLIDPSWKEEKDDYIITTVSPGSPGSPGSPIVIYDDSASYSSPTVITYGDCNLNYHAFLKEYFPYNINDLLNLLRFEGQPIQMVVRCINEQVYRQNVNLGMQMNYVINWAHKGDLWETYTQKLEQRFLGQDLILQQVDCWADPAIDLYLLYLLITTRDLLRNKRMTICGKHYNNPGEAWINNPRNKATIEPNYQININDGTQSANIRIRRTFEEIIKMILDARAGSKIKYRSYLGAYMTSEFIYTH